MVVFDEATKIADNDEPIYGFLFKVGNCDREEMASNISRYIQYLSTTIKWMADGGTIDDYNSSVFYDADGGSYLFSLEDDFLGGYMEKAYAEYPIHYTIRFNYNPKFGEEYLDNQFIIKRLEGADE